MGFMYRGLKAKLDRHLVTEEEVNHHLQRLREQNPRIAVVQDRPAALGDEVVLDYAGFCEGEQFAGGTAENQTLVLGSGMFIPGFEEQLVDKVPGEKVVVHVTFPEQYHAENLAGKDAEFHCTIHAIRIKTPYDLDDVFAKEVGQCETLEEMREKLRESLQSYADERGEMDLQDRLLRMAAETLEFKPSDAQVELEMDDQLQNMEAQLAQQGLNLEMYCQFMGTDKAQIREDLRSAAVQNICMKAAVEQIVDLEGLDADKEEIAKAYALICRQNNLTMDQLKEYVDAEFEHAVVHSVLSSKARALIRQYAVIEEA